MGISLIAVVLLAFHSREIFGANNNNDSYKNNSVTTKAYLLRNLTFTIQSKNNSAAELEEDYIESGHSNSFPNYDKYNYSTFNTNNLSKNSLYSINGRNVTNVNVIISPTTNLKEGSCESSSEDFPNVFSVDDLKHGSLVLVILVGIYCFTILAIICDRYFLPCMEVLCEVLNLSQDVAAATFMSVATSTPELFVNIIGTFITKSDLGVGTIVGSSLFNTLGVASIGSLAAATPIQLDWWPLTRDTIIYMSAVCLLIAISWDNMIFWYEGLTLFVVYFLYFSVMFNNHRLWKVIANYLPKSDSKPIGDNQLPVKEEDGSLPHKKVSTISPYGSYMEDVHRNSTQKLKISLNTDKHFHPKEDQGPLGSRRVSTISHYGSYMEDVHPNPTKNKSSLVLDKHFHAKEDQQSISSGKLSTISPYGSYMEDVHHPHIVKNIDKNDMRIKDPEKNLSRTEDKIPEEQEEEEDTDSVFNFPSKASFWRKFLWIYIFPIKLILRFAIPDPRKHPKLFPLTFVMCIVFIGLNSYVVSWMITLMGNLFNIPDAVLGFTFLAAGGCLPESISITIMSRRGEGSMGVSNSLGANTMNILMSLGLPWFLKTILMGTDDASFINISSGSMQYIIMGLLLVALTLYLTLYFNKFQLRRRGGVILLIVYLTFVTVSIVVEMLADEC